VRTASSPTRAEIEQRHAIARAEAKRDTAAKNAARRLASYHATKVLIGRAHLRKVTQPKAMNKDKSARQAFARQEAHQPAGVKVQQCPGFSGKHRFEADPKSYGAGFVAEWRQLRSAA
jgi:hypothetical protein